MNKCDKNAVHRLYKAILSLNSEDECKKFLADAFTMQELEAIAQRLEVACQLDEGKSYVDINKNTGASTATICRVSKCLNYGDGGYRIVIDRMKEEGE